MINRQNFFLSMCYAMILVVGVQYQATSMQSVRPVVPMLVAPELFGGAPLTGVMFPNGIYSGDGIVRAHTWMNNNGLPNTLQNLGPGGVMIWDKTRPWTDTENLHREIAVGGDFAWDSFLRSWTIVISNPFYHVMLFPIVYIYDGNGRLIIPDRIICDPNSSTIIVGIRGSQNDPPSGDFSILIFNPNDGSYVSY